MSSKLTQGTFRCNNLLDSQLYGPLEDHQGNIHIICLVFSVFIQSGLFLPRFLDTSAFMALFAFRCKCYSQKPYI